MGCGASGTAADHHDAIVGDRHPESGGLVVDCGSGHSSLMIYKLEGGQPRQQYCSVKLPDGNPCRLDRMLSSADSQEQQGLFIAALETALSEVTAASFLLVGATGGVRAAVASGKVEIDRSVRCCSMC